MEPIRLWRNKTVGIVSVRCADDDEPIAALPRAKYDALVKERDEEKRIAGYYREACKIAGHDPILDRFVDAVDSLWVCVRAFEKPEDVYPEDTVSRLGYEARAATARADAASARLARAEALLREARVAVTYSGLAARIDALLDAPTEADRRGEDGAWIERSGE